jgi:hypothetical protein
VTVEFGKIFDFSSEAEIADWEFGRVLTGWAPATKSAIPHSFNSFSALRDAIFSRSSTLTARLSRKLAPLLIRAKRIIHRKQDAVRPRPKTISARAAVLRLSS